VPVTEAERMVMRDSVLPPVLEFYKKANGARGAEILKNFEDAIAAQQ
jgi:hypothetical protein